MGLLWYSKCKEIIGSWSWPRIEVLNSALCGEEKARHATLEFGEGEHFVLV